MNLHTTPLIWRLPCTSHRPGAMKLFVKTAVTFHPRAAILFRAHHNSRQQSTCPQLVPDNNDNLEQHQLNLHSPVDTLRHVLLNDSRPLLYQLDMRSAVQASLSPPLSPVSFPINGQMLDFNDFRRSMASKPYTKLQRRILREQLLRCQTPREIMRVLAVALQRKDSTQELPGMNDAIVRALYRARDKATDVEILGAINTIVSRFRQEKLPLTPFLLAIGIKFAARARSLPGMKRYLKLYRDLNLPMSKNLFRAIIAKCSIGNKGWGEIRNGRWNRRDLLQVLLGFEDTHQDDQHHLGLFLDRQEWTQMHGWINVLARCKASDLLWDEWALWKNNPSRLSPRMLRIYGEEASIETSKGDYWFIEAMADAGDTRRAWLMLKESGIPFKACRRSLRHKLLGDIQHATLWDEQIPLDLLDHYSSELTKIENALGIRWVSLGDDQGYHKPTAFMHQALEALSSPFFKLDPDFGYPHDVSPEEVKLQREKEILHVDDVATLLPKTARKVVLSEYDTMS